MAINYLGSVSGCADLDPTTKNIQIIEAAHFLAYNNANKAADGLINGYTCGNGKFKSPKKVFGNFYRKKVGSGLPDLEPKICVTCKVYVACIPVSILTKLPAKTIPKPPSR